MLWHKISFIFIFLSCHFEPFLWSLKKLQIKLDFFKNLGVLKKKLVQNNLELVFFFDFCFLPTWFRAGKAKYLLNLAREFCRNCVEQNFRENPWSGSGVWPASRRQGGILPVIDVSVYVKRHTNKIVSSSVQRARNFRVISQNNMPLFERYPQKYVAITTCNTLASCNIPIWIPNTLIFNFRFQNCKL